MDRRLLPSGQGAHRTPLRRLPGPPDHRIAPRRHHRPAGRECFSAGLPRPLSRAVCSARHSAGTGLPALARRPRARHHLLLQVPTDGRQRQHRHPRTAPGAASAGPPGSELREGPGRGPRAARRHDRRLLSWSPPRAPAPGHVIHSPHPRPGPPPREAEWPGVSAGHQTAHAKGGEQSIARTALEARSRSPMEAHVCAQSETSPRGWEDKFTGQIDGQNH